MSASSRSTYRRGKTVQTTETTSECRRGLLGVRVGPRLRSMRLLLPTRPRSALRGRPGADRLLVALALVRVLFLSAKHLFYSAKTRCSIQKMTARKRCFGVDFSTLGTSPLISPKKHPHR